MISIIKYRHRIGIRGKGGGNYATSNTLNTVCLVQHRLVMFSLRYTSKHQPSASTTKHTFIDPNPPSYSYKYNYSFIISIISINTNELKGTGDYPKSRQDDGAE